MKPRGFFLLVVCGLHGVASLAAPSVSDPQLQVETVVSGLTGPIAMAFIGPDEFLVLRRAGSVRRVVGGVLQTVVALNVAVSNDGERGALGIVADPDFAHNGGIYIYYTESSTGVDGGPPLGNRLYRYTWNAGLAVLENPELLLDLPFSPGPNHNGGPVLVGPDDHIYLIFADLNRDGQLQNFPNGLPPDDTSVIFRLDRNGQGIVDNPFAVSGEPLNRYYAYGIRNSFGGAFDPVSGDLWDTENGPSSFDEVNRVEPGFNSGWQLIMGPDTGNDQGDLWVTPGSAYSDPEFSWRRPVAPTAMAFANSRIMGCGLEHDLFVGDNNCDQIYHFELSGDRQSLSFQSNELQDLVADNNVGSRCSTGMTEILFGSDFGTITDIQNGPDGGLYVVSISAGAVYRIGPMQGAFTDVDQDDVDDGCDCDTGDGTAFAMPIEVPHLRLSGQSPTQLGWDSQAGIAGSGTIYGLVSGDLASLRLNAGYTAACQLASDLPSTFVDDMRTDPLPGQGVYYLVQAGNNCADATFGDGSGIPDPRDLLDTGSPPVCPQTIGRGAAGSRMVPSGASRKEIPDRKPRTYRPARERGESEAFPGN